MTARLFAIVRTLIVGTAFVSLWTRFLPRWIIGGGASDRPRSLGWLVIGCGGVIAIGCALEFAWLGIGMPAPFDPPRRLVINGPYRWVRNPMYVGLGIVFAGEALTFPRLAMLMLVMIAIAWCATTLFIIGFEEPVLRAKFGEDYVEYCRHVRRFRAWRPWPGTLAA